DHPGSIRPPARAERATGPSVAVATRGHRPRPVAPDGHDRGRRWHGYPKAGRNRRPASRVAGDPQRADGGRHRDCRRLGARPARRQGYAGCRQDRDECRQQGSISANTTSRYTQTGQTATGGDTPMRFTHLFINRPILATVISVFITLIGLGALFVLPVAQYPE